ncbi:MAG: hypothetical protein ABSG54_13565 [Terriglobia bacterium]
MATYEPGDYVKVELTDEVTGESEWLWVRVVRCDDANRLVFGRLDNELVVFGKELKLGQELAVSFGKIRDHKKPSHF